MPENSNILRSTIAIDLGAKYTGTVFINQLETDKPKVKACTFVMPSDEKGLKYSQKTRTAARHRIRSLKRFKLARRLLNEIVFEKLAHSGTKLAGTEKFKLQEALSGLLKRRGYSRIEGEIDLSTLETVNPLVFCQIGCLGKFFNETRSIVEQWEDLSQDVPLLERLIGSEQPGKKEIKSVLVEEDLASNQEVKDYEEAVKTLFADANSIIDQIKNGHKHRTQYLECLKAEIDKDSRLKEVVRLFGGGDRFYNLVGNISNLQLRAMRWYFNRPELIKSDRWDAKHLQSSIVRAFKYFHYKGEDKKNYKKLIIELQTAKNIVEALCSIDPKRTIPVYEDQNNRRPPYDRTLLLSPVALQKRYGDKWMSWATSFAGVDPVLAENLDKILLYPDRKSRVKVLGGCPRELREYKASYILQRVLDRSKKIDPYQLRSLRFGEVSQKLHPNWTELERVIGKQNSQEFLRFCDAYYDEVDKAKSGLWFPSDKNLLERADIHPPMKSKNLPLLVANIFGKDEEFGETFLDSWTEKATVGRSSVFSICRNAEQLRKKYGNEFHQLYEQMDLPSFPLKNDEKKTFTKLKSAIDAACAYLQDRLGLSDEDIHRIKNPFSFAQLYTLTQDASGFCSNSLAVQYENNWRSTVTADGCANCSRLVADSVAPLDGQLGRVLDRQAWEIAQAAVHEIGKQLNKTDKLCLTVLIEQNSFEFTESLAELKNQRNKQKQAQKQIERQDKLWEDKETRIKNASQNICPYTGEAIGELGEIDHIIPRSYSQKNMGTVYNAEPNLIYVSKRGNAQKKDRFFGLAELNKNYLSKQFKTVDIKAIESKITDSVRHLKTENRLKYFDRLSDDEQRMVRHALFLPDDNEAKQAVLETLANLWKTRVNGTQSWFVKLLIEKLEKLLSGLQGHDSIQAFFMSSEKVSELRSKSNEPNIKKEHPQPVASHAIDALFVYGVATGVDKISDRILSEEDSRILRVQMKEKQGKANPLQLLNPFKLWPNQCSVVPIKAKSFLDKDKPESNKVFKETIYSTNFLPIIIRGKEIYVGFSLNPQEFLKVSGKHPEKFLDMIRGFVEPEIKYPLEEDKIITHRLIKSKVLKLLTTRSVETESDTLNLKSLFRSLSYYMLKTDICSVLRDSKKPSQLVSTEQATLAKDFTIEFNFSNKEKEARFSFEGKLIHPVVKQWKDIAEKIHEKASEIKEEKPGDILHSWLQELIKHGSDRPHKHVRKVFSLPKPASPSGGFQIVRTNFQGSRIIQTQATEGNSTVGFLRDKDGNVSWGSPLTLDYLSKGDVVPLEESHQPLENQYVRMDEFRKVFEADGITIWIAPWSKPRRSLKVTLPYSIFQKLISSSLATKNFLDLGDVVKVDRFEYVKAGLQSCEDLMGKPRSNLTMLEIGEQITFQYTPESASKRMKEAFNNPIKA